MTMTSVSRTLSFEETEAFGREMEALRLDVQHDLGERDVAHMRGVIRFTRQAEAGGRALLHFGLDPLSFAAGVTALSVSKILENMEIGHNVMHGQYDWTRDPELAARDYDWDNVCAAGDWRHSHNFEHHTFTNVLGKDRDVGYALLRVTPEQPWNFTHLVQPLSAAALALLFQWGVAMHDLRVDETIKGTQSVRALLERSRPFARKAARQVAKDYLLFPAFALWNAPRVIAGNLMANGARNVWTFAIIFCGHFPAGVRMYSEAETRDESRGGWYVRQLNGSANIEGSKTFHVMTGHSEPSDRAPFVPRHPRVSLPRDGAARSCDLRAVWSGRTIRALFRKQMGSVVRQLFANGASGCTRVARPALA